MTIRRNPCCCVVCGGGLKKNGTTSAGKIRWRCRVCGASSSKSRPDRSRAAEFHWFLGWVLSKRSQQEIAPVSGRTFRRRTQWCWNVEPSIPATGEVYSWVQLDGMYLDSWCCLIGISPIGVIGWQWCDREKRVAWELLLRSIPAPSAVVCDGGTGLLAAIRSVWPQTAVQRCLVHVERDVVTHLTRHPKTEAGKALLDLGRRLPRVRNVAMAVQWVVDLQAWHTLYRQLVVEKTYRRVTEEQDIPAYVKPHQTWWYTHARLRRAYLLMQRLQQAGHLFTFLDPSLEELGLPSTTNKIEGGVNRQLRLLLDHHRGMPDLHQKRAVEWWLWHQWVDHPEPSTLIHDEHINPPPPQPSEPQDPNDWTTHTSAEEGLWTRKGWAGRSNT